MLRLARKNYILKQAHENMIAAERKGRDHVETNFAKLVGLSSGSSSDYDRVRMKATLRDFFVNEIGPEGAVRSLKSDIPYDQKNCVKRPSLKHGNKRNYSFLLYQSGLGTVTLSRFFRERLGVIRKFLRHISLIP